MITEDGVPHQWYKSGELARRSEEDAAFAARGRLALARWTRPQAFWLAHRRTIVARTAEGRGQAPAAVIADLLREEFPQLAERHIEFALIAAGVLHAPR